MNIGDLVQSKEDGSLVGVILDCGNTNNGYLVRWLSGYKEGYMSFEAPKWITLLSHSNDTIEQSVKKCPL